MADRPTSRGKRALDAINAARAVEWVVFKILLVGTLAAGATWLVSDITTLPLAWRVAITFASGIIVGLSALAVFVVTSPRRPHIPSPESSGPDRVTPVQAPVPAPASTPVVAPGPSAKERTEERVMIDVDLEYVRGLHENLTSTQVEQILSSYVGKWTDRSGKVGDVLSGGKYFTRVIFEQQPYTVPFTPSTKIQMDFRDDKRFDRLLLLRRGETITVRGQIESVDNIALRLNNCELLEPR